MKKSLRFWLVVSFVLLAAAVVYAGQTVTYSPFQPDPGDNLSHGEHVGALSAAFNTMDVVAGGIPFSNLTKCSILFEGPAANPAAMRVPLQFLHREAMTDRICGFNYLVSGIVVLPDSKQTVMCRTNPNPDPPGAISIRYTFMDYCP
ncbi:MAG TPA: hypothetical protein VH374_17915 [Polyangia bacterium]|jgi:hypothetical protein|nr:hypothetical protein [Polyangia bacterium]